MAPAEIDFANAAAEPNSSISLRDHYWLIRGTVLALLRNRAYSVWQRLFLIGLLCRQLDSIATGQLNYSVPALLRDAFVTAADPASLSQLNKLPVDPVVQLDAVLRLAGLLLGRSNANPRFADCVQAFTAGIGTREGATLHSLATDYSLAHARHYAPFFERHPHILENYLTNLIVRSQFPFGRKPATAPFAVREFNILVAQFAVMKGLLIGVAGFYKDDLTIDYVIQTFQSAAKHFEHHNSALDEFYSLLVESKLDSERGWAILLRPADV
jgi:lysine-N-methylase